MPKKCKHSEVKHQTQAEREKEHEMALYLESIRRDYHAGVLYPSVIKLIEEGIPGFKW